MLSIIYLTISSYYFSISWGGVHRLAHEYNIILHFWKYILLIYSSKKWLDITNTIRSVMPMNHLMMR